MFTEMTNNPVSFEHYKGNTSDLLAYEKITSHFIFDIKPSENFRRKARFVADGNLVHTSESITSSMVVLRDSIRILVFVADLNDL